ncbi:MAG: hypothetical protein A2Y97_02845, partial [Nitrospirae bacterium RBG_13_39_12]
DFGIRIEDKEGNFIGVMKVVLNIKELINIIKGPELIETLKDNNRVERMLITKDGRIIYSTQSHKFLGKVPDEFLSNFKKDRTGSFIAETITKEKGEKLFSYARSNFRGLDWILILEHETKGIFAPIAKLRDVIFIIALAVTVFAILISLVFSRSITKPVTKLRDAAIKIGMGNLDTLVEVKSKDEIGQLASSFKKMTEDLQETTVSKDYVDNIIKNMNDSLVVITPDGIIKTANKATLNLLGYIEDEIFNQPIGIIFANKLMSNNKWLTNLMQKRYISNVETTYLSKDGKNIPVIFSGSVMHDNKGKVQGIICVAVDITERKWAEEQLQRYASNLKESNEDIKNFAYIVSHDLRAPLINIKGFSNELSYSIREGSNLFKKYLYLFDEKEKAELKDVFEKEVPEALKFISNSVNRMDELINAILKLSRIGRRELKIQTINMGTVVQSILESLAHQIEQKNIRVTVGALPEVIADRISVEQIIGNILDNALKYLVPGRPGEIEITADHGHEETIFQIRDNGRGIAKEDTQKVFDIFRRLGKQDVPGEGMGLAYVKTMIRRHGGRIWCDSELGKGTSFSFTIPNKTGSKDQGSA